MWTYDSNGGGSSWTHFVELFTQSQLIRYVSESKVSHLVQINIKLVQSAAQCFPICFFSPNESFQTKWQKYVKWQCLSLISTRKWFLIRFAFYHLRPNWKPVGEKLNKDILKHGHTLCSNICEISETRPWSDKKHCITINLFETVGTKFDCPSVSLRKPIWANSWHFPTGSKTD